MKTRTRDTQEIRQALRTLGVGLGLVVTSLGLARGLASAFQAATPSKLWQSMSGQPLRYQAFTERVSQFAAEANGSALVFGSSVIEGGFDEDVFTRALGPKSGVSRTENMGISGIDPTLQKILAERVASALSQVGTKWELTLIEFSPAFATDARQVNWKEGNLYKRSLLVDFSGWLEALRRSPTDAGKILLYIALGYRSPQAMMNTLSAEVFGPASRSYGLRALATGTDRGEALRRSVEMQAKSADILELHFNEQAIQDFIKGVKALNSVSRRSRILLVPENRAWVEPTPAGKARLAEVLERIRRETGTKIIDYSSNPAFRDEDFFETTHLNPAGKAKFSRMLARDAARILREGSL
jgi:hypothetical protein